MGRVTFEKVLSFGIKWPYKKPVFVVSTTIESLPKELEGKVFILNGTLVDMLADISRRGYYRRYIDGGRLIQSFLKEDLIDEIIITVIPVLLGDGFPLFGKQVKKLDFECVTTKHYLNSIVQNHFVRKR